MTDDLLDEATRLADDYRFAKTGRILRDLIERVQQAEALKNDYAQQYEDAVDARVSAMNERDDKARDGRLRLAAAERERDAARGKLDKVRALIQTSDPDEAEAMYGLIARDVLAILDGKTGD